MYFHLLFLAQSALLSESCAGGACWSATGCIPLPAVVWTGVVGVLFLAPVSEDEAKETLDNIVYHVHSLKLQQLARTAVGRK